MMIKYIRNVIKGLMIACLSCAISATDLPQNLSVGYLAYLPPISYTEDKVAQGFAVDIFRTAVTPLPVSLQWVPFQDHRSALEALSNQTIDVLVGDFVHSNMYMPLGIVESMPFFVDEIAIVSPKPELSLAKIIELAWTDLLQTTLMFSMAMAIVCWLVMLLVEGSKNPVLLEKSYMERASILFFEVAACFLRDLLYDPVTNAGRILFSLWMFFSVVMVTIILSIIISTIIIISSNSNTVVRSAYDLHLHHVGFLEGHETTLKAITMAGGLAKEYHMLEELFAAFSKQGGIKHAAVGKTMMDHYYQNFPALTDGITRSSITIGYESWVFLYRKNLVGIRHVDHTIRSFLEQGKQFSICQQHMTHPENCLVI